MVTTDADLFKINTRKISLQQKCKLKIHGSGWEVACPGQEPVCPDQRHDPASPMCRSKRIGTTELQCKKGSFGEFRGGPVV